jgi:hypothetical protein
MKICKQMMVKLSLMLIVSLVPQIALNQTRPNGVPSLQEQPLIFPGLLKKQELEAGKSSRDLRRDARARAAVPEVEDLRGHLSGDSL